MAAFVRIGLALAIVLAPAFCCCNVRWLTQSAAAALAAHANCPTQVTAKPSCCHELEATSPTPTETPDTPIKAPAPSCVCYDDRPDVALTEARPDLDGPHPSGEWLPVVWLVAAVVAPEHTGLAGGLDPPERAGVDARSSALFDRHVLRC